MKQKLTSLLLGLSLVFSSFGLYSCVNAEAKPSQQPQVAIEQQATSETVYICTGSHAYAYHNKKNCRGINRCRSCIKQVSKAEAQRQGRSACRICY